MDFMTGYAFGSVIAMQIIAIAKGLYWYFND